MRLVQSPKGISFHETFSDLIFGTLCIFILVIFALVLQVKKAENALEEEVKELVSPNRFTGGSDTTLMQSELIERRNGQFAFYFVPKNHADNLGYLNPDPDVTQEMEQALQADAYLSVPVEDLPKLVQGLTNMEPLSGGAPRYAVQSHYYDASRLNTLSFEQYFNQDREQRLGTWREKTANTKNDLPAVVFSAMQDEGQEERYRVGDYVMSRLHFKNLLRSIKPGSGFAVEFIDWKSREATAPPAWVRSALDEVGYNGRTLKRNAIDKLESLQ